MTVISRSLLSFSSVLGGKLDKYILQRRADVVNLRVGDSDFAELFVDLRALDGVVYQQMHRLTEHRGIAHSGHLMHCMKRCRHVIARHVEPARSRRTYLRQFL